MTILAQDSTEVVNVLGWYVGLGLGFVVAVILVIVLASILALADRIGKQARATAQALDATRSNTEPLLSALESTWSVDGIIEAVTAVRHRLMKDPR